MSFPNARITVRVESGQDLDKLFLATLNHFHLRRLLLVRDSPAQCVLRLPETPGTPAFLADSTGQHHATDGDRLNKIAAFLAPYRSTPGRIANRVPRLDASIPSMDAATQDWENELLALLGQPPTPQPDTFGVIMTHDVDVVGTWPLANLKSAVVFLINALKILGRPGSGFYFASALRFLAGRVDYNGFDPILAIAARQGFTPIFFLYVHTQNHNRLSLKERILGVNPNYRLDHTALRDILSKLRRAGAGIGLHGSFHSHNDGALLRQEKKLLEAAIGRESSSIRQHYLNHSGTTTIENYVESGFRYETNCGFVTQNGFFCGTSRPFYAGNPDLPEDKAVIVVPMLFMDAVPLYFEPGRMEALEGDLLERLQTVRRFGGVVSLNFHQRMISCFPELRRLYEETVVTVRRMGGRVIDFPDVENLFATKQSHDIGN